jgi:hypothetical protein
LVPHPSRKNKDAARVYPTDKDLSAGIPDGGTPDFPTLATKTKASRGWGTRFSHPSRKNKDAARVGHPILPP